VLTRAVGFQAIGSVRMGVFDDMLTRLSAEDPSERETARALMRKCFRLCPDVVPDALLAEWESETDSFRAMCAERPEICADDAIR
jgi:hypothetical protein